MKTTIISIEASELILSPASFENKMCHSTEPICIWREVAVFATSCAAVLNCVTCSKRISLLCKRSLYELVIPRP